MEVYQLLRRGDMHKDFCEDFIIIAELNEQYTLYGVFDGCSTGTDSQMSSALLAKVIRVEMQCLVDEPVQSMQKLLIETVYNGMSTLRNIRNDLILETNELLSTMILLVIDNYSMKGQIIVFGDGFVSINGNAEIIDHDNTPDYLAYYLDELENHDDFELWLNEHAKFYEVPDIKDVSISTDGIKSFMQSEFAEGILQEIEPVDYLTKDDFLLHNKSMLARKFNLLRTKQHLVNQDDIALIRILQ